MKHSLKAPSNLLIGFVLLLAASNSFAQTADEIVGTWWNQEREAQIEIYKSGITYSGKIVWLKESNDQATGNPKLDKNNPDERLRSRSILGSELLHGLAFDPHEKEWTGGTIYDAREGETYKCRVSLQPGGKLNVRGYIGASWMRLGKTNVWTLKEN